MAVHTHASPREGWTGFLILIAVAVATALAALSVLARDAGEPIVLALLSLMAVFGVFALFSFAVGLARFSSDDERDVVALFEASPSGLLLTDQDGFARFGNAALRGVLPDTAIATVRDLELAVTRRALDQEAAILLFRAAARGESFEEEIECLAPATGAPHAAQPGADGGLDTIWLRITVTHASETLASGKDRARLTEWRLQDVTDQVLADVTGLAVPTIEPAHAATLAASWPGDVFRVDLMTGEVRSGRSAEISSPNSAVRDLRDLLTAASNEQFERVHTAVAAGIAAREALGAATVLALKSRSGVGTPTPGSTGAAEGVALLVPGIEDGEALFLVVPDAIRAVPTTLPVPVPSPTSGIEAEAFAQVFETAPIAIAKVGEDGEIRRSNAAFAKMFAPRPGVASASRITELLDPEYRSAVQNAIGTALEGDTMPGPVEIAYGENLHHAGRLYVSPMQGGQPGNRDVIIYAIDLSKQRELEVRFAQGQKMQAVGQLAGGMAHDFNNVLTTIILSSDFLLSSHRPSDPAHKDIMAIKQNATRAAGIVRQLLAFSRQQTLRPRILSLTDIISDWSMWLSRILEEKIELKVSHGRDLWLVKADQTQFEQVIMNLAVNARDAMPEGGRLTIRTHNMTTEASRDVTDDGFPAGEYVACEVSDTGCGMSEDVKEKMFEPFFSTKDIGKGTGLGLATVYGIIKQTGGFIFCDSAEGEGTTFRIYLPRHEKVDASDDVPAKVAARPRSRDLTGTGTVLLVEDEEAVRRFAARALTRQGYKVIEAGSGTEALKRMDEADGQVDLVVSDIMMPEMDGPTLLKHLRSTNPDLKIIFISGYAEDALKSLDENEEFSYLPKPFQLKELVTTVKEALEK